MNPPKFPSLAAPGKPVARPPLAAARAGVTAHARVGLPVVSNRAFIRAWAARRARAAKPGAR